VHAAGERLDVQRLRVLPIDPVADAVQHRGVTQTGLLVTCEIVPRRAGVAVGA
jgi:hypothetical protein